VAESELRQFHDHIDVVDRELLDALERRVRLVIQLWRFQQVRRLPRRDMERENDIVSRLAAEWTALLSEESVRDFVGLVLWISREEATRALAQDSGK
jgi:chorismate mutase